MPAEIDSPLFTALDVANAFLAECSGGDDAAHTQKVALLVGQHLADLGVPGRWAEIQPVRFFEQCANFSAYDRVGIALVLIGIYGWLGLSDRMNPETCARIIHAVHAAAPAHELLDTMNRRSQDALAMHGMASERTVELS